MVRRYRSFIDDYDAELLGVGSPFVPIKPPSRVETIKHGWTMIRDQWAEHQVDGKLELCHDLGIVEPMLFEQIRYGDEWVIECEGVVVERLAWK